jgi:signal transduction histidine kinase
MVLGLRLWHYLGAVNVLLRFSLSVAFLFVAAFSLPAQEMKGEFAANLSPEPIRRIQEKTVVEPFSETGVRAKGVVTWVDPAADRQFFIQDQTGGIQVAFSEGPWPELGAAVDVQGTLIRGPFSPIVAKAAFRSEGLGNFPYAKKASGGGLLNGAYNGEFVEVDGWVRSGKMIAPHTWMALLNSGGARITVRVSNLPANFLVKEMIAANVRVRGVVSPSKARGVMRQLVEVHILAARPDSFHIYAKEQSDPWRQPLVPLRSVFQYHPGHTRGERMHVQGQVIHRQGDTVYLHDGESGLAVSGSHVAALKPGEWVEAVGFLDIENFLPVLADSEIRPSASGWETVEPEEHAPAELLDGLLHANYVAVNGQVLDRLETPRIPSPGMGHAPKKKNLTLVLQSPGSIFNVEVESDETGSLLPQAEIGSTVRVKGVCVTQADSSGNVFSFKILAPGPGHITVIQPASYFTVKRLLLLLSVCLGVLLVVISAASLLARRHTALLAKMRERQTIEAERNRLARELHDTLEQGLTGVQMQLKGIELSPEDEAAQRRERLQTIRTLIEQCHNEIRHCIWNLRSAALDHVDLGEALKRMAHLLASGSSLRVEMRQERASVSIPPLVEDNLLRIGQEAITNSIKHADATEIKIDLVVTRDRITLTITDNGNGLTEPTPGTGHFGLVGMRERAARIGGRLVIAGKPQGGCVVRIDVPLSSDMPDSNP